MCYPNFVPLSMDNFEQNFYMYYWNGMNSYPRIDMKFETRSSDPIQGNNFLHNSVGRNSVRRHKEFKCCFACQDPQNPMPSHKLCLNWNLYLLLNHILYVFRFSWFLGCALSIDEQMIFFQR